MNIKLKSRKFICAVWAMVLLTTLSIWSMATQFAPPWTATLYPFLALVIAAWIGIEGLIDKNKAAK